MLKFYRMQVFKSRLDYFCVTFQYQYATGNLTDIALLSTLKHAIIENSFASVQAFLKIVQYLQNQSKSFYDKGFFYGHVL